MAIETSSGLLKLISYIGVRRDGRLLIVEYRTAPNPEKKGRWIPAPEAAYGEDPLEVAEAHLKLLGFPSAKPQVMDVESFCMGERNWHVIVHYVADVDSDPLPDANIAKWSWCAADELPSASEFAHGNWEAQLARRMIGFPAS